VGCAGVGGGVINMTTIKQNNVIRDNIKSTVEIIRRDEKVKNSLNHYSHELERQCDDQEIKIRVKEREKTDWMRKYFNAESIIIFERNRADKNEQELEKYKIAIKYFQENGKQETKDIIKNLLSY
jgi:hypothetical protein